MRSVLMISVCGFRGGSLGGFGFLLGEHHAGNVYVHLSDLVLRHGFDHLLDVLLNAERKLGNLIAIVSDHGNIDENALFLKIQLDALIFGRNEIDALRLLQTQNDNAAYDVRTVCDLTLLSVRIVLDACHNPLLCGYYYST